MAGRTADISVSSYKPLALDEIMMVPLAKQKMEDEFLASSDTFGNLSAGVLAGDKEKASGIVTGFKDRASSMSDDVINKGISRNEFNKLRGLRKEVQSEFGAEGFTGKAIANQKAAAAYVNKLATDKEARDGWSPKEAQQWAQHHVNKFKGTENEDGSFNSFTGPSLATRVDEEDFLKETVATIAKDINPIGMRAFELGGLPAFKQAFQSGKITKKDFNKVMETIVTASSTNPQLLQSLQQQAFFTGEEDPLDMGHFNYTTKVNKDADGNPILDKNGDERKTTTREFVMGKSRYGRKAAGYGNASSFSNVDLDYTIVNDEIGLKMYKDGMDEKSTIDLIQFVNGEMNNVTAGSLESVQDNLELYGSEVQKYRGQANKRKEQLLSEGMSEQDILKDREYKRLNTAYEDKNTSWQNATARMNTIYKKIDSKLDKDDKAIFEVQDALNKYNQDPIVALKKMFGKTVSKRWLQKGLGKSEKNSASYLLAEEMGVDMTKGARGAGGRDTFPNILKRASERRSDLAEDYLESNPHAEYFTRMNGESTGKYYTAIGGWNKTQSENFSVPGSTLAYNGGTLDQHEAYQDIQVEGEIPKFRVEVTDGMDDEGNSFNNVIITTSKGSTSVQVIDNANNSAKTKLANQLVNGDFSQRKMGNQMLADMNHLKDIKRSGMNFQDEGNISLSNIFKSDGSKIASAKFKKETAIDGVSYYTVTIAGVPINNGQPMYGEKEVSMKLYEEIKMIQQAQLKSKK